MCETCPEPYCLCETDAKISSKMLQIKNLTPAVLRDPEVRMIFEDLIQQLPEILNSDT